MPVNVNVSGTWKDAVPYINVSGVWKQAEAVYVCDINAASSETTRGVINYLATYDYITIATTGNATDFGNSIGGSDQRSSCSSSTRGLFAGGTGNNITYVTIATTGNDVDFGDCIDSDTDGEGVSNNIKGIFQSFWYGDGVVVLQDVTIATTGNASTFAHLAYLDPCTACCASTTRGVLTGRSPAGTDISTYPVAPFDYSHYYRKIEYFQFATRVNAYSFGDLIEYGRYQGGACASQTRGIFFGGYRGVTVGGESTEDVTWNSIEYVTIATTGNGTDFGDLISRLRYTQGSCGSLTRGVCIGGRYGTTTNIMQYVTIATTGSATDFGDLQSSAFYSWSSCSDGNGGHDGWYQVYPANGLPLAESDGTMVIAGGGETNFYYESNSYSYHDNLQYTYIATLSNMCSFGDLGQPRSCLGACSSTTRGIFGGGGSSASDGSSSVEYNIITYCTFSNSSDYTDFGDLTAVQSSLAACSSSTRGVFGGGSTVNVLQYITIATTGNATDFGDLTTARSKLAACSSSTRGVFGGGSSSTNIIDYITIATTGNATDFGDLTTARYEFAACSSSTRGVFGSGVAGTYNIIDYITIATTGNATDFGDLTVTRYGVSSSSNSTRGIFIAGHSSDVNNLKNTIDYITIATTGNATDFGDLSAIMSNTAACSNGHGGLA